MSEDSKKLRVSYKIVLKTTHKHDDRLANCLQTWLAGLDHVIITDHPVGMGNELSMSKSDKYDSNEEKTVNFINHVQAHPDQFNTDWLVFIDDDAILNIPLLEHHLPSMDNSFLYGNNLRGSFKRDPNLDYPSGGSGYIISPELIKKSLPMKTCGFGFEDACMGVWLKQNNIKIKGELPLNGWFPWQKHYAPLWKQGNSYVPQMIQSFTQSDVTFLRKHVTHHYIRHRPLMEYIHSVINKKAP